MLKNNSPHYKAIVHILRVTFINEHHISSSCTLSLYHKWFSTSQLYSSHLLIVNEKQLKNWMLAYLSLHLHTYYNLSGKSSTLAVQLKWWSINLAHICDLLPTSYVHTYNNRWFTKPSPIVPAYMSLHLTHNQCNSVSIICPAVYQLILERYQFTFLKTIDSLIDPSFQASSMHLCKV